MGSAGQGSLFGRLTDAQKFGPIFEVHRVEVRPASAPDEAVALKYLHDLRWNAVNVGRKLGCTSAVPQPVVPEFGVDIDRGTPRVHACLCGIGDGPAGICSDRKEELLVLGWQLLQFARNRRELPINAVNRGYHDVMTPCPR